MIIPNIHPISSHNSDLVASCRHQFKHFLERSIYSTLFPGHVGSPAYIKIRNRSNIVTFRKCTAPGTLTVAASPESLWATPHLRAFSCRNAGSPAPPTPSRQRQCVPLRLLRPLSRGLNIIYSFVPVQVSSVIEVWQVTSRYMSNIS